VSPVRVRVSPSSKVAANRHHPLAAIRPNLSANAPVFRFVACSWPKPRRSVGASCRPHGRFARVRLRARAKRAASCPRLLPGATGCPSPTYAVRAPLPSGTPGRTRSRAARAATPGPDAYARFRGSDITRLEQRGATSSGMPLFVRGDTARGVRRGSRSCLDAAAWLRSVAAPA
jgi:hypothetical protein